MLRITLLSGGELTSIPFMELSDMDIKALKLRLHQQHGLPPRFRQKLMHSDKPLDDDTELDSVIGLEAVPTSPSEPEQLAAAAEHGSTAEGALKRRLDPLSGLPPACKQRLHRERSSPDFVVDLHVVILAFIEASEDQQSRLSWAAARGHRAEVEALLQLPMNPDTVNSHGSTPLMTASVVGHADVAQLLLEAGAQKDVRDNQGGTALMLAAQFDHAPVVRLLLEAGCPVGREGPAVLARMAAWGQARIVQLLLDAGVPLDVRDHDGCTSLILAAVNGRAAVVQSLLEAGAQKDACDNGGSTSLMFAALYGKTPVVQLLLEAGAEIELRDSQGSTALMHAAFNGHATEVKLLLEARADTGVCDWYGKTALMLATERQCDEVRQLLEASESASGPEATAPEL